jgi:hypothetical protein
MPDTAAVQSADDLLEHIEHSLARHYIKLLDRCARGEVTVGVLQQAIQPEAVTDWEAAAILPGEIMVGQITDIRETLCRKSPLVVREGSRKGKPCWKLHDDLT